MTDATTLTIVQLLIPIVVVAALGIAVGAFFLVRRRPARSADTSGTTTVAPPRPAPPTSIPMIDLESALAKVTDSAGRPIRDRIDAESGHIDELRIPDDTGPLLRRALDHVAKPSEAGSPHATAGEPVEEMSSGDDKARP
jgi:hypothetical protein